jgi:hypothetical protein
MAVTHLAYDTPMTMELGPAFRELHERAMSVSQPAPSAKVAIGALVEVLQFCGVSGLDAELVRQAKFNGAGAVGAQCCN